MKIIKADKKGIELAVKYLHAGKSVVYPTDTAYGLGVDVTNPKAVRNLYKTKKRDKGKPIHIVVSSLAMAKKYARFNSTEQKLFKKFLPGPLTLVLELRIVNLESLNILSARTGTIGIRMPKNQVALQIVKQLKKPITATSANLSTAKTTYAVDKIVKQFRNKKERPNLFLDAGTLPKRKTSTIVKIENGKAEILRQGPITRKQIIKIK